MMSYEEYVQICIEDEENRQANPACINCTCYYEDYGMCFCKKHDNPKDDVYNDKCKDWR